ncbi:MAG: helix-turn-helix domain-containing protein [Bacteroidales bacterium]|nr:helix-turn-helix domain-containing protein [Bacteroidales bacterium]MDD7163171.1 helix-turn-helix domain-containing protein [Bacteroidales bacterium]
MYASLLVYMFSMNISKRTLQHYRDTSVLPFIQIGHKCYYKREDVKALLEKSNRQ